MSDERNHELQRHAASVRSLARDLLRDAHAAEDVTQQTLTKAWAVRRQLEPGPLGGWLRRTVTNFTRQWRRGERRRTAREEAHRERSPVDAPPTPAEVLARRETLRKVTDAVLGLDEPYQTVVFLRYFEDLPPRAIARRTNTNVATVKSQLARGLALLRSRLGSDPDTDWRPALAGAFGIPLGSALIPVTTGVLLMKTSVKVAAAAVVLCVGGLMFYDGSEPAPPPVRTDARADDPSGAMAQTLDGERPEDLRRTALSDEVRDEAWLTHPYEVELHVHCVDSLGVPVKNHQPRLSPPNGELLYAEATDEHGVSVVRWRTRQPLVEVEVLDPRRHRRRIALEHGKPAHITLVQDQRAGEFIVYAADGASPRAIRSLSSVLFVPGSDGGPSMGLGLHPHAIFAEQGIVAIEPPETPA
ncbi:MAG: sigma-70 family RNA polymerase sigma factor, partial [Planctomycetes bacterium]|nr:sigma-70 family RNA polymerase sigma factor [Planctomycetota bacterium]